MKNRWIIIGVAGVSVLLGAAGASASSYNPLKWIKKGPSPTASEQLAANQQEEKKLSLQLQAVLPPRTSLRDACAGFKTLNDCVASLHVSHNLNIKFNCLKWDVTGGEPARRRESFAAPSNGKAQGSNKAILVVKPGVGFPGPPKTNTKTQPENIQVHSS